MVSEQIECPGCGAILLSADEFCGECGAPRPSPVASPAPPASPTPGSRPTGGQAPVAPLVRADSESAWRYGFYILLVLGVLACLAGVLAFFLFGLTESDVATSEENWFYSALCCLAPIGGTGALLLLAGIAIWYARLREPGTTL